MISTHSEKFARSSLSSAFNIAKHNRISMQSRGNLKLTLKLSVSFKKSKSALPQLRVLLRTRKSQRMPLQRTKMKSKKRAKKELKVKMPSRTSKTR